MPRVLIQYKQREALKDSKTKMSSERKKSKLFDLKIYSSFQIGLTKRESKDFGFFVVEILNLERDKLKLRF